MNVWMKKNIMENPYYRNAFRVTKVPRGLAKHKTVVKQIGRTKKLIDADPKAHVINGEEVTHAEVNAAEEVIMDPEKRMYEELLEHASEKLNMKELKKIIGEIDLLLEADDLDQQPITNPVFLNMWAQQLIIDYINNSRDESSVSCGDLETRMIPPFGLTGGDNDNKN